MRQRLRSKLTYANVTATLALFLVLSGGTAVALNGSNTVFSDDIVNGEVKVADVGQGAVATDEIANGQVKAADIGDSEVMTAEIANGQVKNADIGAGEVRSGNVANDNLTGGDVAGNSLKGADIDESTLDIGDAARAYARLSPSSCTGTPGTCGAFGPTKGISSVSRTSTGAYCITAPGISSDQTPAAVTVDWSSTFDPEGNASAMYRASGCGPTAEDFEVVTERQPVIAVDAGGGTNNAIASGRAEEANDVGFTIVIP
jgi:hypothetical protein